MKLVLSLVVLALVGGLSGCAGTTGSVPATDPALSDSTGHSSVTGAGPVTGKAGRGDPLREGEREGQNAAAGRPDLKRSVYYEFDKFDVKPEYHALVETHAKWLRANPRGRLMIEGNADERGSREYNLALGQRRAESVVRMMVVFGVRPEQIEAVSFGKEKPRAAGHDEAAWAENRRADFADR
jgi:peptidoglycan-associated lipoprotein